MPKRGTLLKVGGFYAHAGGSKWSDVHFTGNRQAVMINTEMQRHQHTDFGVK